MIIKPVLVIAKYSFLEALRNRLLLLAVIGLLCALGLSEFISELAITESAEFVTAILASILRIFCVFVIGLFVITSVVREFQDKGFDHLLALPYPRYVYYFGKFLGFSVLSVIVVLCVSIILLLYVDFLPVLQWSLSLMFELFIIVALGLLFIFTFRQVTQAFSGVMAFYLLARSMQTIQLISDSPVIQAGTFSQQFIGAILDLIALLLPRLDLFARTEWLLYNGFDYTALLQNLGQVAVYIVLLSLCSLFDLYRMEL